MAVTNNLAKKAAPAKAANSIVTFMANGSEVKLTPTMVKNYLVSGDADRVTDQELAMFINLCKYSGLNPWLREAYCIKYGNAPATMVTGKETFLKRAENNPQFDGMDSGIIVKTSNGDYEYRTGMAYDGDDVLVGGWAEVFRKDRTHSTRVEVSFKEYAGRTKEGKLNNQWSTKPATMIRKVAQVHALREAFPNAIGGMYIAEEQGAVEPETTPLPIIDAETGEAPVEAKAPKQIPEDEESLI